ncbi:hypothetical protein Pmar_PMAR026107, partial [Perkinsus marinus ATCC 50983]
MPSARRGPPGRAKEANPLLGDLPKDSAKAWEIDIVECLEKLKVELFEDDDDEDGENDNPHPINFAQAAIGLYHSAAVYARKIDSLYLKMYETMELLGRGVGQKERRKNAREARKIRKKLGIFDDGDGCELLDSKITRAPEGQLNMLKAGNKMNTNHSFVHRVPLFLVPREEGDRKRPEYKVSSCTVNPYNMAVLLPDLEGRCYTNQEEYLILQEHSGNPRDGAEDAAPLPPPPTQAVIEAPGISPGDSHEDDNLPQEGYSS